jgi:hypothetical protein
MAAGLFHRGLNALPNGSLKIVRQLGSCLPAAARTRLRNIAGMERPRKMRRHILGELGIEGFFWALDERRLRYVVLRWFEILPRVRAGGDVDLLIADDAYDAIADLFDTGPAGVVCDVYTVSGQPGTSYHGAPYFPPDKSALILERAVRFNGVYMVPSPEDHFFSLAFHAVYQKGLRSGLPTNQPELTPEPKPNHDYAGDIAALAQRVGIEVEISMEGLDACLAEHGWRPTRPMIESLAPRNPWIATALA